jgi:hypothetical protein
MLSLQETVDLLWDDIESFTEIYQTHAENISYYGGKPIYKTLNDSLLNGSFESNQHLIQLAKQNQEI